MFHVVHLILSVGCSKMLENVKLSQFSVNSEFYTFYAV